MKVLKYITFILALMLFLNFSFVHNSYAEQSNELALTYDGKLHIYNEAPIKLIVKDREIKSIMPPIIFNGNTLVPTREVFEAMDAVVEWKSETKEAFVGMEDTLVILKMNSNQVWVNGEYIDIPMAPKIINDKVMIPVRFVAETIGFNVKWLESEREVRIDLPEDDIIEVEDDIEVELPIENEVDDDIELEDNTPPVDIPSDIEWDKSIPKLPTKLASKPIVLKSDVDISEEVSPDPIKNVSNPIADIVAVKMLDNPNGLYQFKVSAASPISSIEDMVLEDRLVIDIGNANMKLSETTIEVANNYFVKAIRASQYSSNPKVVRVVFDLKTQLEYDIIMASDRMSFIIQIKKSLLSKVELSQNSSGDILTIYGNTRPSVNVFRLTEPDRLVIDAPYSESYLESIVEAVQGQYVEGIRTAQFDLNTYRIVLDLNGQPEFQVSSIGSNGVSIQILTPSYKNIQYINGGNTQILLKKPSSPFASNEVIHRDDYLNKVYSITLPKDYSSLYGHGIFHIGDGKLDSIQIGKNSDGKTELIFIEKSIYAYDVYESQKYIIINILKPTEKYSKIMVLDAGHGGKDPGASGNGVIEKEANLDITLKLNALLKNNPDIKVYTTRISDTYPTLQERSALANEVEADIFVSIHNNSFTSEHKGTETLYFPTGIDNSHELSGKKMAQIFQNVLVQNLGTKDRGIKERPGLYVLRTTSMPAVIVEIAFVSNKDDANLLKSDNFRQKAAIALYEGILKVFENYPTNR
jgi:N-acetylmuramoyl-L-alanine amidase